MTTRINQSDLEAVVNRINRATGNNLEAVTRGEDGKYTYNIGTYVLDGAYGGWKLQQIMSDGGGVTNITSGYIPKRELYYQMQAFLAGIDAIKS